MKNLTICINTARNELDNLKSMSLTNINYTVTYNGSTTPPTDVGTYNVVVTINDPNYQGTKTATLTVAPQTLSITTQCPSKTYGDDDFTITTLLASSSHIFPF
jgi:hypothetical protein